MRTEWSSIDKCPSSRRLEMCSLFPILSIEGLRGLACIMEESRRWARCSNLISSFTFTRS